MEEDTYLQEKTYYIEDKRKKQEKRGKEAFY